MQQDATKCETCISFSHFLTGKRPGNLLMFDLILMSQSNCTENCSYEIDNAWSVFMLQVYCNSIGQAA
jgi:hypothetical protein